MKKKRSIEPPLVAPLGTRERRRVARVAPLARRLLWIGLAVAAGLRLSAIAVQPIMAGYQASRDIRALEGQYRQAHGRNQRLKRLVKHLNTSAGVEEEARRLGWVRPGERPIRVIVDGPELLPGTAEDRQPLTAYRPPTTQPTSDAVPERKALAERVQQMLATWSATRWIGSLFDREARSTNP